jgi:type III secretory pathway component EscU
MTRAFLKAAFIVAVILLTFVFLLPGYMLLEFFLLTGRGDDRLLPGVIVIYFCIWTANRITSLLFWRMHLSYERWSVLNSRPARRSS